MKDIVLSQVTLIEDSVMSRLIGKNTTEFTLTIPSWVNIEVKETDNPQNIKQFILKDSDKRLVGFITVRL